MYDVCSFRDGSGTVFEIERNESSAPPGDSVVRLKSSLKKVLTPRSGSDDEIELNFKFDAGIENL